MKVTISQSAVKAKIDAAWKKSLFALSAEILEDCNEYCKEDKHTLINSSYAHSSYKDGKLVWQTPYAKRQYWAIPTSLTPGRTWKWCETAKRRHKDDWQQQAQRGFLNNL